MKRFFAVAAVLLLLLRPLCEVQAATSADCQHSAGAHAVSHHGADAAAPCCAGLDDRPLVKLSESAAVHGAGDGELVFATPGLIAAHDAGAAVADAQHRPGTSFTRYSFYARSARIRR